MGRVDKRFRASLNWSDSDNWVGWRWSTLGKSSSPCKIWCRITTCVGLLVVLLVCPFSKELFSDLFYLYSTALIQIKLSPQQKNSPLLSVLVWIILMKLSALLTANCLQLYFNDGLHKSENIIWVLYKHYLSNQVSQQVIICKFCSYLWPCTLNTISPPLVISVVTPVLPSCVPDQFAP